MPSYDLIHEQWIPCLLPDGRQECFGLAGLFQAATEIREVRDQSPLVTGALHRLLLAVLHRAIDGPKTYADWEELWGQGGFQATEVASYLDHWGARGRFDLFDDHFPFYQSADLPLKEPWPSSRLAQELAAKTDPTLFDHSLDRPPPAMPAAEAARYLVATQSFALGGFTSTDEVGDKFAKAAPLANGALVLIRGRNLFETLMLNLHHYSALDEAPFPFDGEDSAAWERDEPTQKVGRRPAAYVDWLTWQSRRIRLLPEEGPNGTLIVPRVVIVPGVRLPEKPERRWRKEFETMLAFRKRRWRKEFETMLAFRRNLRATEDKEPWPPLGLRSEHAVWRDSLALFQTVDNRRVRPKTIDWLHDLRSEADVALPSTFSIEVLGLGSAQKKPVLWRHERFEVPTVYLDDPRLVKAVASALKLANRVSMLFQTGWFDDRPNQRNQPRPMQLLATALVQASNDPDENKKRVALVVKPLGLERRFWARLDGTFLSFIAELPNDRTTDEDGALHYGCQWALRSWASVVEDAANTAFRDGTATIGATARSLKAVALADGEFRWRLDRLLDLARRNWQSVGVRGKGGNS